jgi:hypothetical protein
MQRELVTIPQNLLRVMNVNWDIDWRGQSAGDTTAGNSATVYNAFPCWVGAPKVGLVRDEITQWRAIRAKAQGRIGIYRVSMVDPLGFSMTGRNLSGKTFAGGQNFSTGAGFANIPVCSAVNAAARGATEIRVSMADEPDPVSGQIMSHQDWPFVITSAMPVGGGLFDLGFEMPLRAAIAAGDLINLRGVGRFEVADAGAGNPAYDRRKVSEIQLSFRVVLNR